MKLNRVRRTVLATGLMLAAQVLTPTAWAQDNWPAKPVKLIVPFPAGGSTDLIARYIATGLSAKLGQQFVVDNRGGASGNIGTDIVARASADGYTLGLVTSGPLVNNKFLFKNMPFDAERDLTPIALACEIPMVIVTNPSRESTKTLPDFLAAAKAAGSDSATVGIPGHGTIGHLTIEAISLQSKAQIRVVPYRGDMPGIVDVLGGTIDAMVGPITSFIPNIQSGKLHGLAVTSSTRFPALPNIPTAKEQGLDINATVWLAVVGPAQLPASIVNTLNTEINALLNAPEGREQLARFGAVANTGAPNLVRERIGEEGKFWQKVIQTAGIRIE